MIWQDVVLLIAGGSGALYAAFRVLGPHLVALFRSRDNYVPELIQGWIKMSQEQASATAALTEKIRKLESMIAAASGGADEAIPYTDEAADHEWRTRKYEDEGMDRAQADLTARLEEDQKKTEAGGNNPVF